MPPQDSRSSPYSSTSVGNNCSGGTAAVTITLPADHQPYSLAATSQSGTRFTYNNLTGGFTATAC